MSIEDASATAAVNLSGGNQQKLLFGRTLERTEPGVLLMNEPTRGIDVGARAEIYRLMRELCDLGYALIMTSSDLEEVVGMADIVVTMYRGRTVARYDRERIAMSTILADITHPAARRPRDGIGDPSLRGRGSGDAAAARPARTADGGAVDGRRAADRRLPRDPRVSFRCPTFCRC